MDKLRQLLDKNQQIVDPATGTPTPFFQRLWQQIGTNNPNATTIDGGTDFTGGGTISDGTVTLGLSTTGVVAGHYTNTDLTVDSKGRITAASNGTGGGSGAYRPMVTGSGPPVFIYEPNGSLIMEAFTPGT